MLFARALLSFLILPGLFAFVLPAWLASTDQGRGDGWTLGWIVVAAGMTILFWCVRDFYVAGKGTLAPWDPPRRLVVVGLYRYLRNPMYVGVLTLVLGWALVFGSPVLLFYVLCLGVGFHLRTVLAEEPYLAAHFGEDWTRYRASVRRWWPRTSPWRGGADGGDSVTT